MVIRAYYSSSIHSGNSSCLSRIFWKVRNSVSPTFGGALHVFPCDGGGGGDEEGREGEKEGLRV